MFCTKTRLFERRVVWFSAYWIKNPLLSRCYGAAYTRRRTRPEPRGQMCLPRNVLLLVQRPRCTLAEPVRRTRLTRIVHGLSCNAAAHVSRPSAEKP